MTATVQQIIEYLQGFYPDLQVRLRTQHGLETREMKPTDLHVCEPESTENE